MSLLILLLRRCRVLFFQLQLLWNRTSRNAESFLLVYALIFQPILIVALPLTSSTPSLRVVSATRKTAAPALTLDQWQAQYQESTSEFNALTTPESAVHVTYTPPFAPGSGLNTCAIPGNNGPVTTGGVVNTYFSGSSSLSTGGTSISLGSSSGAATGISPGDILLVIQMQHGTFNSTNTDAYGNGVAGDVANPSNPAPTAASGQTSVGATGVFEYIVATNTVGTGGGTVNLAAGLQFSYFNTAATAGNGQQTYQVIRVPQYAALTLSGNITPAPWDGARGGVVALDVTGNINFSGFSVNVSGMGFRGGRGLGGGYTNPATHEFSTANTNSGFKGEGIMGTPINMWDGLAIVTTGSGYPTANRSTGAPGNAGGGGAHDSGGGGGANGGAGGHGGDEYCNICGYTPDGSSPNHTPGNTGGFGGGAFTPTTTRLAMGGGGGGGADHNSVDPNRGHGGLGGGIALVRTGSVSGGGSINANGANAPAPSSTGNAGGGGAGGSVMIVSDNSLAGLTLTANGGIGGSVTNHAPGGGGGGGVIFQSGGASTNVIGGTNGTRSVLAPTGAVGSTPGLTGSTGAASSPADVPGTQIGDGCKPLLTVTKSTSTSGVIDKTTLPQTASYTITLTNTGNGTARNVRLSDLNLPTGFQFVSGSMVTTNGTTSVNLGGTATVNLAGTATAATYAGMSTKPASGATALTWGDLDLPGNSSLTISYTATMTTSTSCGIKDNPAAVTYDDPTRSTAGRRITPFTNQAESNAPTTNKTYETGNDGNVSGSNYSGLRAGLTAEDIAIGCIDTVKSTSSLTQTAMTTFEVPFTVLVGNSGTDAAPQNNVQVSENLNLTFPSASSVTIKSGTYNVSGAAGCAPNASFNGSTNYGLLSGSGNLTAGQSCTINFTAVVVFPAGSIPTVTQNNTVYASATASGPNSGHTFPGGTPTAPASTTARDSSTNSSSLPVPPNGDTTTPTPVSFPIVNGYKSVKLTTDADSSGSITAGDSLTWTLWYANTGTINAALFQINDTLPAGVTIVATGGQVLTVSGTTTATKNINYTGAAAGSISDLLSASVTFNVGDLIQLDIPVIINAGFAGNLANQASATGNNLSDNIDNTTSGLPPGITVPAGSVTQTQLAGTGVTTATIIGIPNVVMVKTVTPTGDQIPGTDLAYSILYTNDGSAAAQSFVINDPVPPNTDFKVGSSTINLGTTGLTIVTEYSNDNGITWSYVPVSGGGGAVAGYDRNVKTIRWRVTANNLSQTSPNNVGEVGFIVKIR